MSDIEIKNRLNLNDPKYKNILPVDIEFFERIMDNITCGGAIEEEIPVSRFFNIVRRSTKWFWSNYDEATQEKTLYLPFDELVNSDQNGNTSIKLPDGIEAITHIYKIDGQFALGTKDEIVTQSLTNALLGNYGGNYGNDYFSGSGRFDMGSYVIKMYELSQYKSIGNKGLTYNYNKNTSTINFMTKINTGLVLKCALRLSPRDLYNDYLFEDYVTACVSENITKVVGRYNFNLIGGVEINLEDLRADGKEQKEKIEAEIKENEVVPFIMMR